MWSIPPAAIPVASRSSSVLRPRRQHQVPVAVPVPVPERRPLHPLPNLLFYLLPVRTPLRGPSYLSRTVVPRRVDRTGE